MFIRDLAQALSEAKIRYCIVGGVAVNLHGAIRRTYNVDLVVEPTRANLETLARLLDSFGLESKEKIRLTELADKRRRRRLLAQENRFAVSFRHKSQALHEVDVVVSPPIDAVRLLARAKTVDLAGVPVRVVALTDLMLMKRVSGRLLDAGDVARLERLRRARRKRR